MLSGQIHGPSAPTTTAAPPQWPKRDSAAAAAAAAHKYNLGATDPRGEETRRDRASDAEKALKSWRTFQIYPPGYKIPRPVAARKQASDSVTVPLSLVLPSLPKSSGAYVPPHLRKALQAAAAAADATHAGPSAPSLDDTPKPVAPRPKIMAMGDSFIGPLSLVHPRIIQVYRWSGASAKGLGNPKSTLQTGAKILGAVEETRPECLLLIFGTVDVQLNYCYRLLQPSSDPLDAMGFVDDAFAKYQTYLETALIPRGLDALKQNDLLQDKTFHLIVAAAVFPVIQDEHLPEAITRYNRFDNPEEAIERLSAMILEQGICDILTRTKMTERWNAKVSSWCASYKADGLRLDWIDINTHITTHDPSLGVPVVLSEYRDESERNVHILWEETVPIWVDELARLGVEIDERDIMVDLNKNGRLYKAEKTALLQQLAKEDADLIDRAQSLELADKEAE